MVSISDYPSLIHINFYNLSNGEEWFRLRTNVNQMMMRPQAVTEFLPQVNEVADDFIVTIKSSRDSKSGQIEKFNNEISKWTLESMTCFLSQ